MGKKYKNVTAKKAERCVSFFKEYHGMANVCLGVKVPFETTCGGYKCKCTEYKLNEKG